MRKILSGFFLTVFCMTNVVADDNVTISRALVVPAANVETQTNVATRAAITRSVVPQTSVAEPESSAVYYADEIADSVTENGTVAARVGSRATGAAPTDNDVNRTNAVATRSGISRSLSPDSTTQRDTLESAVRNVGRSSRTQSASINSTPAARRAGVALRPSTAEVGGRATIAGTDVQTGSNIAGEARAVQTRAAAKMTKETIAEAKDRLEQTADLNKSCQAQYNDCMDQFCAVIDANQKRCSCSANLSRYTRVERAVKDANTELNDVAQRIRYIGLSADEIRAIMSATEAEQALSGKKDTTESRNMLDAIEKLIKNPTGTTTNSGTSSSLLDMDLDFSGQPVDIFNLDLFGTGSGSFSNLRGTELYNAAKKRCNTVLNQCKGVGATTQQITGNYDLAIDKDCIAYEAGLNKMNETLKSNVRSADQMLKKARLAVMENKNQYDAKGCIGALNTCMMDDMVCGADYEKCLDPTKKYIDENGTVVLGQNISDITAFMAGYNNAAINNTTSFWNTLNSVNYSECAQSPNNDGRCIIKYLLSKIGTGNSVKDGGLCRAVLDKCQLVTYNTASGIYNPHNEVIINYLQRAMVNIHAAQKRIIADYASTCMVDIATCYNQQVSQVNTWSAAASTNSVYNVMRGACRNVALTCAYAVFDKNTSNLCTNPETCINDISTMFYQSLLCPDNSTYQITAGTIGSGDYVNERCKCDTGYVVVGKTCSRKCVPGTYRDATGYCSSCPAGTYNTATEAAVCQPCGSGMTSPVGSTMASQCTSN